MFYNAMKRKGHEPSEEDMRKASDMLYILP